MCPKFGHPSENEDMMRAGAQAQKSEDSYLLYIDCQSGEVKPTMIFVRAESYDGQKYDRNELCRLRDSFHDSQRVVGKFSLYFMNWLSEIAYTDVRTDLALALLHAEKSRSDDRCLHSTDSILTLFSRAEQVLSIRTGYRLNRICAETGKFRSEGIHDEGILYQSCMTLLQIGKYGETLYKSAVIIRLQLERRITYLRACFCIIAIWSARVVRRARSARLKENEVKETGRRSRSNGYFLIGVLSLRSEIASRSNSVTRSAKLPPSYAIMAISTRNVTQDFGVIGREADGARRLFLGRIKRASPYFCEPFCGGMRICVGGLWSWTGNTVGNDKPLWKSCAQVPVKSCRISGRGENI